MVSILGNISRLKVECVLRGLLIGRGQEVKGVNEKDEDVINPIQHGLLANLFRRGGYLPPPPRDFQFSGLKIRV